MEHWYHPNGFHCFVSLDKDKETLRERGWKSSPFKSVCYRRSDFCAGGVFPYGPWVMNTPIAPRVSAPVYVDEKGEYTESYKKLKEETGAPLRKRGRPKKKG